MRNQKERRDSSKKETLYNRVENVRVLEEQGKEES